jgi:hypothetical protein
MYHERDEKSLGADGRTTPIVQGEGTICQNRTDVIVSEFVFFTPTPQLQQGSQTHNCSHCLMEQKGGNGELEETTKGNRAKFRAKFTYEEM